MPTSHHSTLTDDELLAAYRGSGDNQWLGYLLQRHTLLMLGVAMKYMKDKDAAEDAVQQLFIKALTRLPDGPIQNFKGWLYMVLRNHCLQQLRDHVHTLPDEVIKTIPADAEGMEEIELKNYTLDQLHEVMPQLPGEQYQCIQLFYLKQNSYQEVCECTGFTFGQVKSHIQNGKRNLKIALLKKLNENKS